MNTLGLNHFHSWMKWQIETLRIVTRSIALKIEDKYDRWHSTQFSTLCYLMIVTVVAIYDIVLTISYAASLQFMERNPICRWLMGLHNLSPWFGETPDLSCFLAMKILGTMIVLTTMYLLMRWRSRIGYPVSIGVSSFQVMLAIYLTLGANS